MEKIDFVLTWVDGDDPEWQEQRAKYSPNVINSTNSHYRDYGTLKYWFRAVEKFAPWVNKIHFVTCGQKPDWLNENHPKLNLVDHSDYMPSEFLPTFSVNPIELNFHRIKGLEEKFVYFNDDTFICAETSEEDFFKNGLPCDSFEMSALIPSVKNEVITYILFNDMLLINANKNKRECAKRNVSKWFSSKYGKGNLRNLYYFPIGKFSGFVNPHLPNSFLKSTFEDVWDKEGEYLTEVSENRFRTIKDVNQYLMRYWQLVDGKFCPRSNKIGKCFVLGNDNSKIEDSIKNHRYKLLCVNDNPNMDIIEEQTSWLNGIFEEVFPEKSEFEK